MSRPFYHQESYDPRRSIGYLIRHARNLITSQIEDLFDSQFAAKQISISFVQYVVLMNLRDNIANTSSELCQSISYDSGAFTRLIDQLEKRGLLLRKRSTKDRRIVELKLTTHGRKTVNACVPVIIDYYNYLLSDFTREEAASLIDLMSRFLGRLSSKQKANGKPADAKRKG